MKNIILAIDQGTTSTRVVLINSKDLSFLSMHQIELPQHFPAPSHVEHDLSDIWSHTLACIDESLKKASLSATNIVAIGITNQRETTCAFDKKGTPLARAIVWQDKRTHDYCLENSKDSEHIRNITGLPLDPYFSATKMRWLLKNNENVKHAAKNNSLCLSTIDSFLLFKLTNGASFRTDATNASRTLLLDLKSSQWNADLLNRFEVSKNYLPEVCSTFSVFGTTSGVNGLPDGIPILCMIGDQQSALLGQRCSVAGMSKCTYGTGAFFLLNTGSNIARSQNGLLSTIAYKNKNQIVYALEGASFIAGAGVQWFRDQLKGISNAAEIEEKAKKIVAPEKIKNLFFFPFFSGLGSPYWKSDALACIYGMSRDTGLSELSYALLDGLTQAITDLKEAAESDLKQKIASFHVDGGACRNNLLMQMQSNYLGIDVCRPKQVETTVMGAALGTMLSLEDKSADSLASLQDVETTFKPSSNETTRWRRNQWKNLIQKIYLS